MKYVRVDGKLAFDLCLALLTHLFLTLLLLAKYTLLQLHFIEPEWEEEEVREDKEEVSTPPPPPSRDRDTEKPEKDRRRRALSRVLKWSPVAIALLTYHNYTRLRDPNLPLRTWEISCYRMLPWRTVSRTWGFVNSVYLPVWAREPLFTWYSKTFGCNIMEAEIEDLCEYRNLGEFFRRGLKPGARPICPFSPLVSPADGKVLHFGKIHCGLVEQVKGVSYSLQAFLGPSTWLPQGNQDSLLMSNDQYVSSLLHHPEKNSLYTCVIYLAPGDYHRFHSPADCHINFRRHFGGELLSVNPRMAQWISGLFTLNERAVYVGNWEHGFFSMTAVGATNVGSIRVYKDPELLTNSWQLRKNTWRDKDAGMELRKGDPFGEFNLGSTIVLVFEAPSDAQLGSDRETCSRIQVGQPLFSI